MPRRDRPSGGVGPMRCEDRQLEVALVALVALVLQLHHSTPHARDFFELSEGIRGR